MTEGADVRTVVPRRLTTRSTDLPDAVPLPRSAGTGAAVTDVVPVELHPTRRSPAGRMRAAMLAADAVVAVVPVVAAHRAGLPLGVAVGVGAGLVGLRAVSGLHRDRLDLAWSTDLSRSATALAVALGLTATLVLLVGTPSVGTPDVGITVTGIGTSDVGLARVVAAVLLAWGLAEVARAVVLGVVRMTRTRFGAGDRTIVVGAGRIGRELVDKMIMHPEFGLRPVAIVDPSPFDTSPFAVPLHTVGLAEAVAVHRPDTVVLAFSRQSESGLVEVAMAAQQQGCRVLVVPRLYELHVDGPHVERLRGYPLVRLAGDPTRRPSWRVKRLVDLAVGALATLLAVPALLACAVAVLVESGRPVLFVQQRVGQDGRAFDLYKFRSMRPADEAESQTRWNIAADDRIGPVGRVLRRTSLDELPQLWNILRGDMSLVGPRPERPGFALRFAVEHERYWARHRVPAGLTGLAQVSGLRGDTSIADRARYDNYYINAWSLALDLSILARTAREMFRRGDH